MAENEDIYFHHALKVLDDVCIGCTHCMNVCPTSAIRVNEGLARIMDNRCIDCGECHKACPVNAIIVEQDDFEEIRNYRARVALLPGVLIGQFPEKISTQEIYTAIHNLGFTHIFEVENTVPFILEAYREALEQDGRRPLISSFCPAIIRLIQVRFPSLTENILRIKPPIDLSAVYYREKLESEGFKSEEIGIFYITPCAAKIASVKSPVGGNESAVTGVINMKFLYNRINRELHKNLEKKVSDLNQQMLSKEGIQWSLTNGEIMHKTGRSLAVDGVHNVSEFLEKIENDELEPIEFLELRACDQSCAGGILISGNRFLTVERLKKRSEQYPPIKNKSLYLQGAPGDISLGEIKPRPMAKLDEDISNALVKMKEKQERMKSLPSIDCGACGSPDCETFAEDVVQGRAEINQCFYIQNLRLSNGDMSPDEAMRITSRIWGEKMLKKKQG